MTESHFKQAIHKCDTGTGFKKTAEGYIRHIGQLCYFSQRDLFLKILVHVFNRFPDAPAVIRKFNIIESGIR